MTFYNTTNLTGQTLKDATQEALTQEDKVQLFFNQHPCEKFLPSDVEFRLKRTGKIPQSTPITSIRRAMSNLKKDGRLDKLPDTGIGAHGCGAAEHFYQLSAWVPAGYSEQHPINILDKEAYDGQRQND
jgi:hypothetical protein